MNNQSTNISISDVKHGFYGTQYNLYMCKFFYDKPPPVVNAVSLQDLRLFHFKLHTGGSTDKLTRFLKQYIYWVLFMVEKCVFISSLMPK